VIGDGEAETGPLATSWHSNKFLNPASDGAVLPILHLNGYKIANPTILARISREELQQLLRGYGWTPYFVEGHEPAPMHEAMAAALDTVMRSTLVSTFLSVTRTPAIMASLGSVTTPLIAEEEFCERTLIGAKVAATIRRRQEARPNRDQLILLRFMICIGIASEWVKQHNHGSLEVLILPLLRGP